MSSQSIVLEKQNDRSLHVISLYQYNIYKHRWGDIINCCGKLCELLWNFNNVLHKWGYYCNNLSWVIELINNRVTNDKNYLIGVAHNEFKYIFLKVDITEDGLSKDLLYDYDSEHQILVLLFKKYLFYVKLKG